MFIFVKRNSSAFADYMKIKKLQITSLYGEKNIEWKFDESVNILAGINGSFKTTLLNIISHVTNHEEVEYPVSSVMADYTDDIKMQFVCFEKDVKNLVSNKESNKFFIELVEKQHPELLSDEKYRNVRLRLMVYYEEKDGERIEEKEYMKYKKIDYVSTFDVPAPEIEKDESPLDAALRKLQEQYAFFLSDLSKQVSDEIEREGSVIKSRLAEIYMDRDLFVSIVNDAFKPTGKKLDPNESKIAFVLENGQKIPADRLSAGEKQLLIIYLTVLLEKKEEFIVLLDEPEISLHVALQYQLLDNLVRLNPNAQFIVSTHSPAIFGSGWGDKIVYVENLAV